MAERIFREKSMEKISSPEQLDDYIKVNYLGAWLVIGAVIVFLFAVAIWGMTETIDNVVEEKAYSDGEKIYCYLSEEQVRDVCEGQNAKSNEISMEVEKVADMPDNYRDMVEIIGNEKAVHALGISKEDWKYLVILSSENSSAGFMEISITVDSMSPMEYLFS